MTPNRRVSNSLLNAWIFCALFGFVFLVHGLIVTYGSGRLFSGELLGRAYDSLAKNLVHGKATVDRGAIQWEVYAVQGKSYMYFGPFPALLRIGLNFFFPFLYGQWSRVMFLTADFLSLAGLACLLALCLGRNPDLGRGVKRALFYSSFLGFALGSPLFYLMACPYLYHEPLIWATAASVWALYFLFLSTGPDRRPLWALAGLSAAVGAALLSKLTFLPLAGIVFLTAVWILTLRPRPDRPVLRLAFLLVPVLLALAFYAWYNNERFGSPWVPINYRYYIYSYSNPRLIEILARAGDINPARIPVALSNYFGLNAIALSSQAPFVHMVPVLHLNPALYVTDYRERVISLLFASPWLVLGGFSGILGIMFSKNRTLEKLTCLAFLAQWGAILSYYFITHRYSTEFLPLLLYGCGFFLSSVKPRGRARDFGVPLAAAAVLLCLVSITVTVPSTLSYTAHGNWAIPIAWKSALDGFFARITG